MELLQKQIQRLSQQQIQSVELLQMNSLELSAYLQNLSQENPVIDLDDAPPAPEPNPEDDLLHRLQWLEDNDRQNRYYQSMEDDELDPMARVGNAGGLEETLTQFLSRQLDRMDLDQDTVQTVRYLASCLDENGYFRFSLDELSHDLHIPTARLASCLDILRTLEPAGVGAENLSQCLALQLQRIGVDGPPLFIVRDHLEELAKSHYRSIAGKLHITVEEVLDAQRIIRELEPRPGAIFEQPGHIQYILPDVFVEEKDGRFQARTRSSDRPAFQISSYYRDLLAHSNEAEVREYLGKKVRQAENVLWAIGQRESTLQRCAQAIVDHQEAFFRGGPCYLSQLRMADVAQDLDIHESTVSRAVREKYLQCVWGVYPLNYFFSRSATSSGTSETNTGGTASRALLRQLIEEEDKAHPLSDQKLCEKMVRLGCPISRRTAAKYREELLIPSAAGRRQREN